MIYHLKFTTGIREIQFFFLLGKHPPAALAEDHKDKKGEKRGGKSKLCTWRPASPAGPACWKFCKGSHAEENSSNLAISPCLLPLRGNKSVPPGQLLGLFCETVMSLSRPSPEGDWEGACPSSGLLRSQDTQDKVPSLKVTVGRARHRHFCFHAPPPPHPTLHPPPPTHTERHSCFSTLFCTSSYLKTTEGK